MNTTTTTANKAEAFYNEVLGKLRYVRYDGTAWFVLKDIATMLEVSNSRDLARKIRPEHVCQVPILVQTGIHRDGTPAMMTILVNLVDETGLWVAVTQSRKPVAQDIIYWVSEEVLPSIRKHGGYIVGQEFLEAEEKKGLEMQVERLAAEVARLNAGKEKLSGYLNSSEDALFKEQAKRAEAEEKLKEFAKVPKEVVYFYKNPNGHVKVDVSYKIPTPQPQPKPYRPARVILADGTVTSFGLFAGMDNDR